MSQLPQNIQQRGTLVTNNDDSQLLYNVKTLKISEDGTYDFTGVGAVNIFGGLRPATGPNITIDATTLVSTQVVVFVNTGLKPTAFRLSNGGAIAGQPAGRLICSSPAKSRCSTTAPT